MQQVSGNSKTSYEYNNCHQGLSRSTCMNVRHARQCVGTKLRQPPNFKLRQRARAAVLQSTGLFSCLHVLFGDFFAWYVLLRLITTLFQGVTQFLVGPLALPLHEHKGSPTRPLQYLKLQDDRRCLGELMHTARRRKRASRSLEPSRATNNVWNV